MPELTELTNKLLISNEAVMLLVQCGLVAGYLAMFQGIGWVMKMTAYTGFNAVTGEYNQSQGQGQ